MTIRLDVIVPLAVLAFTGDAELAKMFFASFYLK